MPFYGKRKKKAEYFIALCEKEYNLARENLQRCDYIPLSLILKEITEEYIKYADAVKAEKSLENEKARKKEADLILQIFRLNKTVLKEYNKLPRYMKADLKPFYEVKKQQNEKLRYLHKLRL